MNKKILIINDRLHSGGVENVLQSLVFHFKANGDNTTIWAYEGDRKTLAEKYPVGTKYFHLPFWNGVCSRFSPKWFFCRACRVIFEGFLLRLRKWDAVIAFKEGPSMRLAAKLRAEKKLAWIHTDYEQFHWSKHEFHSNADELQCMQNFDYLVCVSQAALDSVVNTLGDPGNLCVRYNPINVPHVHTSALELPADCVKPEGKPLFISVGRLSEIKRYDMLMDICGELEKEFDFELWIVGGGEEEAPLREKLERDGVKSMKLLGARSNPYPYIACADWFVSSSASESYGLAVQEALILGTPVIASYCPAIAETVDADFGIITGSDKDSIQQGLRAILENPTLAEEYRHRIHSGFDTASLWEDRLNEITSLLD